jgi:hypothetical protein
MEANTEVLIGLGLFVASEIIGLNPKWRSNSVLQLLLAAGRRAYPYRSKPPAAPAPLDVVNQFIGRDKKGRR